MLLWKLIFSLQSTWYSLTFPYFLLKYLPILKCFWSVYTTAKYEPLHDGLVFVLPFLQVRSKLTSLDDIVPPTHGFMISSTSMNNVWLSMEHQAILWCNQLVVQVSRFLLCQGHGLGSPSLRGPYHLYSYLGITHTS